MTAALGIGAGGPPAIANAAMNTGDIQINAYTYGDQVNPAIAMAPDGRFVIAWTNKDPDGDGDDIFAQRYDISGNAVGPEFQVNTSTAGNQYDPAVAMAPNGNFVITWTNNKQHGDWRGIYGQRYDSVGNPIGSEFKVNIHTISLKDRSSAAVDSHGNFVITWSSHNQDGDGWEVYARRYDSAGNPAGPEFRVNTQTTGHQEGSSIGMDTDGNFVIAWVSRSTKIDITYLLTT